jgi:hypothetical protein
MALIPPFYTFRDYLLHSSMYPPDVEKGRRMGRLYYDVLRRGRLPIVGLILFSLSIIILSRDNSLPISLAGARPTSHSLCSAYSPLYDDLIHTSNYFRQRGGITIHDYETSKSQCENEGECIQIKLFNNNLYIGKISDNPHCGETRAESLILNLYRATEQARAEGELLPNIDVFMMCSDLPSGQAATWYLTKNEEHAAANPFAKNGPTNFFLMPDFNFYAWPESYSAPYP